MFWQWLLFADLAPGTSSPPCHPCAPLPAGPDSQLSSAPSVPMPTSTRGSLGPASPLHHQNARFACRLCQHVRHPVHENPTTTSAPASPSQSWRCASQRVQDKEAGEITGRKGREGDFHRPGGDATPWGRAGKRRPGPARSDSPAASLLQTDAQKGNVKRHRLGELQGCLARA